MSSEFNCQFNEFRIKLRVKRAHSVRNAQSDEFIDRNCYRQRLAAPRDFDSSALVSPAQCSRWMQPKLRLAYRRSWTTTTIECNFGRTSLRCMA